MNQYNGKRIASNAMFMYLRMVLTMLVSLFTVRVILEALGVEDYGVYMSIAGVISSLSFISSVLASASQRFFSYELANNEKNRFILVFGTTFITYLIISFVIALIGEPIGLWFVFHKMVIPENSISSAHWIFQFALASFLITLISNPFQAIIISYEKMKLFAYISIIEVLMKLVIAFGVMYCSGEKLKAYALFMFVASIITHSIYVYGGYKLAFTHHFKLNFSLKIFKDIFHYTSWTMFGTIAGVCNTQGLNILLNIFYGPIANAAYAIANQVSVAVNSLATNFFVAVRPPLIKSYASGNRKDVDTIFYFSTKMVFILLFIIAFPVIIKVDFLLKIWLGEVSEYMVAFVQLILIYTLVLRLSDPITVILQAANKVKVYHGIVDSFTMLTLPLSYLLLRLHYSADIVFVVSIIIFLIAHFIRMAIMNHYFSFSIAYYLKSILLPIVLTTCLTYIAILPLEMLSHTFINDILQLCITFIISVVFSLLIILTHSEREKLFNFIKNR